MSEAITQKAKAPSAPVVKTAVVPTRPKVKSTSVPPSVLLYMAWKNLTSRKLRTMLTVFGVTIGIGAIFFLLSLGLGLHNLVTSQIIGDKSIKSIDVNSPNSKILKIDHKLVSKVSSLPHVTDVGTAYSFPGSLAFNGGSVDAVSYGVNQSYERLNSMSPIAGRLITENDTKAVVLNLAALKTIGIQDPKKAIGQTVRITVPLSGASQAALKGDYKIVGVVNFDSGSELFIQKGQFDVLQVPYYSSLRLTVDNTNNVTNVRHQIESLGYQTTSPLDTLNQINQIFRVFTIVLVGFGGIGMVVSILGMFNTLTISLLERTREIGLMMVMGARAEDMRKLFTYEASLLSLFGAILGVFLAIIIGLVVEFVMNIFARQRGVHQAFDLFSTPWWAVLGSIVFMLLVGLLVVHFPAQRAKRINPIDALRRE